MKCEEAAEFVSALCDGERIPPEAAEHIGVCEFCHTRLREYTEMEAELRRVASLESEEEAGSRSWEKTGRVPIWWRKGWAIIRIPRFVFSLLLAAIVVLGSTLAIVKARAHSQGTVLMLTAKTAEGQSVRCPLSLEDKNSARCASMGFDHVYGFRIIAVGGNRIELGVRIGLTADLQKTGDLTYENIDRLPEKQYWFQPGEKLEIAVPGIGTMLVTGELLDHMPALVGNDPGEQIDPEPDELRFVSPVLLRGKEVVFDFDGASAIAREKHGGIEFYAPREGLFHISLSPLEGAVEGRIAMSRISFELDGQSYMFLLAAPVARGEHVWILRDASYKPSDSGLQDGFLGSCDESHLLAKPLGNN